MQRERREEKEGQRERSLTPFESNSVYNLAKKVSALLRLSLYSLSNQS
jgi:hypothetical protein